MNLLLLVGQHEEFLVGGVQLLRREVVTQQFEPVHEGRAAAAGREGDDRLVQADVLRVDDLISLALLQHPVLVDARRMGESVAAHDSLVRLHGHVHQARHQVRSLGNQL